MSFNLYQFCYVQRLFLAIALHVSDWISGFTGEKNNNDDIEVFKTHVIFYTLHCRVESRTSSSRVVN